MTAPRARHPARHPARGDRPSLWLLAPALALFGILGVLPLFGAILLSLTRWNGLGTPAWAGFASWAAVLQDPVTWATLGVTIKVVVGSVVIQAPLSLLIGVYTAPFQRYRALLAALFFLPLVLSSSAVAIMFKNLLDPNFGLISPQGLAFLAGNWLGDPNTALPTVILIIAWHFIPLHALLYQAGVRQIPASLYEAAVVDGAGPGHAVLRDHAAAAAAHDRYLHDADGGRLVELLRPDLRADRRRPGLRDAGLAAAHVPDRVPGHRDGQGERHRDLPGGARADAVAAGDEAVGVQRDGQPAGRALMRRGAGNLPGGAFGLLWLGIVIVPIYWVLATSLRAPGDFFIANQFSPPVPPAFENYARVFEINFVGYLLNSVVVTMGAVALTVAVSFLAAYVIVRNDLAFARGAFSLFLLGLAIPIQAAIIPVFYLISQAGLYDTLLAVILPSAAFAVPITVFILSNFVRDIPRELFEAMQIDGAGHGLILRRLVLPLSGPALITVAIYNALNVWNGFLFPLVLTQSANERTLPLALWSFQDEMTINVPVVMAAVVLTSLPMMTLYILGRRYLVAGLTAGVGK